MPLQRLDLTPTPNKLAESLGTGLNILASHKLSHLQRQAELQNRTAGLQGLGYAPEEAKKLSFLPDALINSELNNRAKQQQTFLKHNLAQQQQQAFENALYGQGQQQNPMMGQQQQPQYSPAEYPSQQQQPQQQRPIQSMAPLNQPVPRGLNPQQYKQFLDLKTKQQHGINSQNAPFLKELGVATKNAEETIRILDQMEYLVNTGKVDSDLAGSYKPSFLQSTETQDFDKLSNTLVQMLSGQRGVPTGFKIKFAQTQKPNLTQHTATQKLLIRQLREEAEKVVARANLKDEIINQENGGHQPPNIESLIRQRIKQQGEEKPEFPELEEGGIGQHAGESPLGLATRTGIRGISRAGEAVLGAPGDIGAAGLGLGNYVTGGAIPTYEELDEKFPFLPPTSEQLKNASSKLTGGYTEPRGVIEKGLDDFISLASSLGSSGLLRAPFINTLKKVLSPGAASKIGHVLLPFAQIPWQKALKLASVGTGAKKVTEVAGGGPLAQGAAQLGAMVLFDTGVGRKVANNAMQENYDAADAFLLNKKDISVPVKHTQNQLKALYNKVNSSFDPAKKEVAALLQEAMSSIESKSHNLPGAAKLAKGTNTNPPAFTTIPKLIEAKKDINKWYDLPEKAFFEGQKHLSKSGKKYIEDIGNIIRAPIAKYGLEHPGFGKPYSVAEDLYGALHDVGSINRFLDEHASTSFGLKSSIFKVLSTGATLGGVGYVSKVFNQLKNHPLYRDHFLKALASAAKDDVAGFTHEVAKMKKEEDKIFT